MDQSPLRGTRYFFYWGKARPADALSASCHLLPYHCLDVAAVGSQYLARHPSFAAFLAQIVGAPSPAALCSWVAYWLALHDLGKFAESFQGQRSDLWWQLQGVECRRPYTELHDSLGHWLWQSKVRAVMFSESWFGALSDDHEDGLACWSRAVTGHHGQPPGVPASSAAAGVGRAFRPQDIEAALAFARDARELLLDEHPPHWVSASDPDAFSQASTAASWCLAGLAVLSDWIGSNADVFRYEDQPRWSLAEYWPRACHLAAQALEASGVLPVERQAPRSFQALFPSIQMASPLQQWAASVSLGAGPQIHLLEDVTGAGKTEAALALTHRLIAAGCAEGFFIGLPTMATANAMYGRVARVFTELMGAQASLVLAHGRKGLVESFALSVISPGHAESDFRQVDDTAPSRCTAWLADHNKRALLAAGGVGTIDQALLAALQRRHQSLRLLGLFRKVLVVDEVHACDAYMQGVLETLLRLHAQAGGSAVLLSATLPQAMKRALLGAFAAGRKHGLPALQRQDYPLVSSWSSALAQVIETPLATRPEVRRDVAVRYESDRATLVEEAVAALSAGRCVAWICNTIGDALALREMFGARLPANTITLFHARFALGDRLRLEDRVLARFGSESTPDLRRGQMLIATQVAEQSLDVDFDLVVSDLAPIDRLIQRAGRLCRHVRDATGARLREPGRTTPVGSRACGCTVPRGPCSRMPTG